MLHTACLERNALPSPGFSAPVALAPAIAGTLLALCQLSLAAPYDDMYVLQPINLLPAGGQSAYITLLVLLCLLTR